jgi:hypothetical protein
VDEGVWLVALTHEQLEALWPEGPVFAYRAAIERLVSFEAGTMCPGTLPAAQQCWDFRVAAQGLLRVEAERIEVARRSHGINQATWLMTSRAVNWFAAIALEGAR